MIEGKEYFRSIDVIKPRMAIFKYKHYDIKKLHPNYIIREWYIIVNNKIDKIIENVILADCWHPNAWSEGPENYGINKPPQFSRYCLPNDVIGAKLVSNELMEKYRWNKEKRPSYVTYSKRIIEEHFLKIWSMDDPHHYPSTKHINTEPSLPKEIVYERYI